MRPVGFITTWTSSNTAMPADARRSPGPPSILDSLDHATLAQAFAASCAENERLRQENASLRGVETVLQRDLATAREGAKELRAELARRDARDARNAQVKAAAAPTAAPPASPAPAPPPRFTLLEIDLPEETPAPKEGS